MNTTKALLITLVLAATTSCGRGQGAPRVVPSSTSVPVDLVQICGDPNLLGVEIADISDGSSCGVDDPVQVYFVSGVELSTQPKINCKTARALRTWVDDGAQPSVESLNAYITKFRVVAHYACRTRNSQPGARISEHAKGNAIDIAGFTLSDGTVIDVEEHWRADDYGETLRRLYSTACGPFGTTLGPDADRHHQDHMHFDTADYRSGTYCR